jgi:hypothetical protein
MAVPSTYVQPVHFEDFDGVQLERLVFAYRGRLSFAKAEGDLAKILKAGNGTDYMSLTPTDELPLDDLQPILLGLFGEVGSIMATAKKFHREKEAYAGCRHAVEEEFGDALWYFSAVTTSWHRARRGAMMARQPSCW